MVTDITIDIIATLQYDYHYCDYNIKKFTEHLEKGQNKLTIEELKGREESTQANEKLDEGFEMRFIIDFSFSKDDEYLILSGKESELTSPLKMFCFVNNPNF
ncbi:hypothetical protein C2G38_2222823 [Gigaspora rosea]|uniref:Uncharacterized protein n=1 Tax=Gigaspora rosea TaxID=44941 RepID=A0A397U229_9GLOM|nr:hypothetical protein C2G38_2222823 [Gigaspora rosea]